MLVARTRTLPFAMSMLLLAGINTCSAQEVQSVAGRDYRYSDGAWHELIDGKVRGEANLDADFADGKRAMAVSRGSGVRLAIIDVGMQFSHPDLAPNVWINMGEDSDGDGLILYQDGSGDGCRWPGRRVCTVRMGRGGRTGSSVR